MISIYFNKTSEDHWCLKPGQVLKTSGFTLQFASEALRCNREAGIILISLFCVSVHDEDNTYNTRMMRMMMIVVIMMVMIHDGHDGHDNHDGHDDRGDHDDHRDHDDHGDHDGDRDRDSDGYCGLIATATSAHPEFQTTYDSSLWKEYWVLVHESTESYCILFWAQHGTGSMRGCVGGRSAGVDGLIHLLFVWCLLWLRHCCQYFLYLSFTVSCSRMAAPFGTLFTSPSERISTSWRRRELALAHGIAWLERRLHGPCTWPRPLQTTGVPTSTHPLSSRRTKTWVHPPLAPLLVSRCFEISLLADCSSTQLLQLQWFFLPLAALFAIEQSWEALQFIDEEMLLGCRYGMCHTVICIDRFLYM